MDKKNFKESLNMINRQVDDIHHLVDEFSSFARMPSPKLKIINVTKVINEYLTPLVTSFNNITITVDNIIPSALIMGDDKQIRQAISNLIKNSYENLSMNKIKDGKVSIFYKTNKDSISISIHDNGTGINSSDVSKILCYSDVFLLPSQTESFGLAALEAMAAKTAVISTNTGGLPEVNIHGVTGYLSDLGDVQDMADNAVSILENDEILETFKENAREHTTKFSLENILPVYESIYKSCYNN